MKFWVKELWYILCLPLEIFKNLSDFFKSSHIFNTSHILKYFVFYCILKSLITNSDLYVAFHYIYLFCDHSVRFNSVQFSRSVLSASLQPHGLQHTRPPCPSPTPRVYSNSCPLSQSCHPTISSSVVPL